MGFRHGHENPRSVIKGPGGPPEKGLPGLLPATCDAQEHAVDPPPPRTVQDFVNIEAVYR